MVALCRLLRIFLLALCLLPISFQLVAQVMVSPTGQPGSLVVCGNEGSFSLQIANTTGSTMSGAILTLDLPSGVRYAPGSISGATESDITNLNQPVFLLPDIGNNSAHTVTYLAGLICGYTNTTNFNYTVTYNTIDYTGFDTPLQTFYFPEPVIYGISNNPVSIPLNTTTTRDITILQQGDNAPMDTLVLLDQHTTDIYIVSVNIGTLHYHSGPGTVQTDTIILTGNDLPGGNGLFDPGETIIISETVTLLGCTDGESTLMATWGCYGEYCNFNTAYATVNVPAGSPSVNIAFTANRMGWGFIDNRGWVEYTVSNTGTGAGGTAYDLTALAGFSSGSSIYYPNGNWINKIDSFSVNGKALPALFNYGVGAANGQFAFYTRFPYTIDPDGAGTGITDADGDGYYDDLPAGQSFVMRGHTYYSWTQAVSTIATGHSCGSGWTNSAWQGYRFGYHFTNQCDVASGVNWIANPSVNQLMTYNTNTSQVSFPADIYDGVPVWFEQTVNTSTSVTSEGCPNDSVVYKVVLPAGVEPYLPYTATFKGVSMGSPLISGDTLRYILSRSRILSGGEFRVPLIVDCEQNHPLTAAIHAELKFWCDKTNFRNRFFTYWCADSPLFGIQCPLGNCPEPNISVFETTRHTMGWTNSACTTRVTPSTPGIRLENAMTQDTIRILAAGGINSNIDSLYFKLKHNSVGGSWGNQLFFDVITDTLHLYNIENDTWYTCFNLSPQVTNGTVSTLYTYFGNLTSPGSCMAGVTLTNGDSVVYILYGRVKNIAQQEWRTVPGLRAYFFWKEQNREAACNERGYTFNVLGNNYNFQAGTNYQQIILQGCSTFVYEGLITRTLDVCGGDLAFPNEIRPLHAIDTIFFTLPEGFAYQTASSTHRFYTDNGSSATETIADPVVTVGPTGTRLMYVRGVGWSYSDYYDCWKNNETIRFSATTSCMALGNFNYTMDVRGRKKFYVDGAGVYQTSTSTKAVTHTPPLMSLTTLVGTAEGRQDSVHWTVSICNSRTFASNNNWLGFESGNNGIQVVKVTDITIPAAQVTIPLTGYGSGKYWVQLGTFNGNECRTIKITALYSTCSFDSLLVKHGYNCAGYPINPELGYAPSGYQCTQNLKWLYLDPKEISLNLTVTSPVNPVDLCNELEYEAIVTNSQLAYGYELKLIAALPPGASIINELSEFKHPYTTGTWTSIGNPVNEPPGSNRWVFDISNDPNGIETLKGSDDSPENGFRLRFRVSTNCNLTSGTSITLTASAENACGDVMERTSSSNPILINGLPTNVNLYVISTQSPGNLTTCSDPSLIKIKVINLGPSSVSQIEKLGVNIDDAYDYLPNSLTDIHNGPSGVASNTVTGGIRYINFSIQPNLPVNDSIVFTFQLYDADPAGLKCDTISFETTTLLVAEVNCLSAPGGTCSIQSITSSLITQKPVIKDVAEFGSCIATSVANGATGELVTLNYHILNSGTATLNSTSANVYFFFDANGNRIADEPASDSLYRQIVDVTGLQPGDSIVCAATFSIPAEKICGLAAALRLPFNTCICDDKVMTPIDIRLFNAGNDLSVCQLVQAPIGSSPVNGYNYAWVPSNYLNSNQVSDPLFLYNDILTEPDTLLYTLLTTRPGNCISSDTMSVIILPAAIAFAGKDSTLCGGPEYFIADAVVTNSSALLWTTSGSGEFSDATTQNPVYMPTPADVASGFVTLTLTAPGLCGTDIDAMKLSFTPPLAVSAGPDATICEQATLFLSEATAANSVGLIWNSSGDGYFTDPTTLNPVYIPGSEDITAGSVILTLEASGIEPCINVSDWMTLTFRPPPYLTTYPLNKEICSENATNINLTADQAGSTFHWGAALLSGTVTGFYPGSGTVINDILQNTDVTSGSVVYSITPDYEGCIGNPVDFMVLVKPKPIVTNNPQAGELCSTETTEILLNSTVTETTFSYGATASSPAVDGYYPSAVNPIAQSLSNSGTNVEQVTYHVTPSANGCEGSVSDLIVNVFPVPSVVIDPVDQTICGSTATLLTLSSPVSDCSFSWTALGSSPQVTGYSGGAGETIIQKLYNLGQLFENVTYAVTPMANNCSGLTTQTMVTVKPLAVVDQLPCFDLNTITTAQPIRLKGGIPLGGWYSGSGVDTVTGIFSPSAVAPGIHKIFYNYRNTYLCNNRDSINVTVQLPPPFSCGQQLIDIRDNTRYPTIQLGSQCWLQVNLNYGIALDDLLHQTDNCVAEKYLSSESETQYRASYQWDEVMNHSEEPGVQGLCPPGWHVPTATEWQALLDFSQGSGIAGGILKDLFAMPGFHGYLYGIKYLNLNWYFTEDKPIIGAMYWTSTLSNTKPIARGLNSFNQSVSLYESARSNAFQVRCLKD